MPNRKWSKKHIIEKLQNEGLHFSEFTLTHEGDYAIDDADWNYKDVPHLHHIHQLVEAYPTTLQDDLITTLNVQKVLGLKMPLSVVNYQSGKNEQTYYTTWLSFILIVRTHYEMIGPCKTRVVTTYNIGSPWVLKWCAPIIRFLLKRNYKDLMSGDIPMRQRRGQLRNWGYSFHKEGDSYTFPETTEILKKNVLIPEALRNTVSFNIDQVLPDDGEHLVGRSDHIGMRLIREGNDLFIFPRMCPHEGASLDDQPCANRQLKCPWHGRIHHALAHFDLEKTERQNQTAEKYHLMLHFEKPFLTVATLLPPQGTPVQKTRVVDTAFRETKIEKSVAEYPEA